MIFFEREFLNYLVYIYLDNILIYSPDLDTHKKHVAAVLQQLLDHQLSVKGPYTTGGNSLGE